MGRKPTERAPIAVPANARSDKDGAPVEPSATVSSLPFVPMGAGGGTIKLPKLFENLGKPGPHVAFVRIFRLTPTELRGDLGTLDSIDDGEEEIAAKFGGGKYMLHACDGDGRTLRNGSRQVTIPGEPKDREGNPISADALANGGKTGSLLQFIKLEREANQRLNESRIKEANEALERERLRTENEIRLIQARAEQDRKDAEAKHARELERLRFEAEEREKDREARMRQVEREAESRAIRDREFMQSMLSMQQTLMSVSVQAMERNQTVVLQAISAQRSDGTAMMQAFQNGIGMAMQLGGGGDPSVETLKMLSGTVEKGFEAWSTDRKVNALEAKTAVEKERNKLLTSGASAHREAPRAENPAKKPEKKEQEPPHEIGKEPPSSEIEKAKEELLSQGEEMTRLAIEKGIDPRDVMRDVIAQLKGEVTAEELLGYDEEEENEEEEKKKVESPGEKAPSG